MEEDSESMWLAIVDANLKLPLNALPRPVFLFGTSSWDWWPSSQLFPLISGGIAEWKAKTDNSS
jgi:hypothetical protein